jgi:hypothetical protein
MEDQEITITERARSNASRKCSRQQENLREAEVMSHKPRLAGSVKAARRAPPKAAKALTRLESRGRSPSTSRLENTPTSLLGNSSSSQTGSSSARLLDVDY